MTGAPVSSLQVLWQTRAWPRALVALALGAIWPLAFSPFDLWPLAPLAFAGLVALVASASPARAFLYAYLAGIGMFGVGVTWIHESFQFNNVHGPVVWVLSVIFVAFLALFPGAWGYAMARLHMRLGHALRVLGAAPAVWILCEWVRGWFLTGFTWLQLGYSQTDAPGAGLAALAGTYGIGWFLATSGAALAFAVVSRRAVALSTLAAVGLAWGLGASLRTIEWTEPAGDVLTVAAVQGNYAQDVKWRRETLAPTLARYRDLTQAQASASLVVWPETSIPQLAQRLGPFLDLVGRQAAERGATVLIGAPFLDEASNGYFNSMLAVGAIEGVYHKRHLVPFGEYVPMSVVFLPIMRALGVPLPSFTPWRGSQSPLGDGALRIGLSICYEAAFGAEIIESLPDATLLVNVSNDAWFGDTLAPHQHLQIARMRSIETGRYMVRATNTGISALVSPSGEVLGRSPQFETHVLVGEVVPMRGMTPYAFVGDWPVLMGCALMVALSLVGQRRSAAS